MVDVFTFISLILTPAALILAGLVVWQWSKPAVKAVRSGTMAAYDWLALGILISFIGYYGDATYWGIAWHMDLTGHPSRDWWFRHGPMSNVIFRQSAGIAAGLCHTIGAYMILRARPARRVAIVLSLCLVAGMIYAWLLLK